MLSHKSRTLLHGLLHETGTTIAAEVMAAVSSRPKSQKESFGERLRRLRRAKGLTQEDLALKSGSSQRMLAYYETRDGIPGAPVLLRLAQALELTPDELLGLKLPPRSPESQKSTDSLRLWKKLRLVETLPPAERRQIVQLIEALVERQSLRRKAS